MACTHYQMLCSFEHTLPQICPRAPQHSVAPQPQICSRPTCYEQIHHVLDPPHEKSICRGRSAIVDVNVPEESVAAVVFGSSF